MSPAHRICVVCPKRERVCAGTCHCTVSGRPVRDHAAELSCPLGHHQGTPLPEREAAPAANPPTPIEPLPRDQWPLAARVLAKLAIPVDVGLGDVLQRLAERLGGERFKRIYKRLMGHDCRCSARQREANEKYPLGTV